MFAVFMEVLHLTGEAGVEPVAEATEAVGFRGWGHAEEREAQFGGLGPELVDECHPIIL